MATRRHNPDDRGTTGDPAAPPELSTSLSQALTSPQIVVLAAYLLGGERKPIDTEDLAVRAHELAPGRFCWRKYRSHINLELVRVYASDAKKRDHGALMRGSGNEGWMLTQAGVTWAESNLNGLEALQLERDRDRKVDRILRAEHARLLASEAFRKLQANPHATLSAREAEDFFRIDPYVPPAKREERIQRILNAFADDPDLGTVVQQLVNLIRRS